jgi:hypothetical protein
MILIFFTTKGSKVINSLSELTLLFSFDSFVVNRINEVYLHPKNLNRFQFSDFSHGKKATQNGNKERYTNQENE